MEFSLDIFGTIKIQRMRRFGIDTALNKFNLQLEPYQNYSLFLWGLHLKTLDFWQHFVYSILGALCIGHWLFPSFRGQIWFSCGLGGEKILKLKGNIISDPPPNICSTCGACLKNLIRGSGSVNLYVSVEGLSDFMLVLYFFGHYALPFWEHYAWATTPYQFLAAHMAQQGLWNFYDSEFLAKWTHTCHCH